MVSRADSPPGKLQGHLQRGGEQCDGEHHHQGGPSNKLPFLQTIQTCFLLPPPLNKGGVQKKIVEYSSERVGVSA